MPKILFLDQSGNLGGAELCLLEIAKIYRETCLVILFKSGHFQQSLESQKISVKVLKTKPLTVKKDSSLGEGLRNIILLGQLVIEILNVARQYDLIYANTQKALIVGALVSLITRRPLVYHLHDILSTAHFSSINRFLAVNIANHCATLVIANSQATKRAFIEAKGYSSLVQVVYNGFEVSKFDDYSHHFSDNLSQLKQNLDLENHFVIGHFSRLSPWKGQHILLQALTQCSEDISVILVGDALFEEEDYKQSLWQMVKDLDLIERVKFLGFQMNVIPWIKICDLIVHSSALAEPFGRVIIEGMLSGKPVIATNEGGAAELVINQQTGWLVSPNHPQELAEVIMAIKENPGQTQVIAQAGQAQARNNFDLERINRQITLLIEQTAQAKR